MTLAPFLLAAFFGLLISALLYFVLIWPSREPPDVDDDAATGDGSREPDAGNLDRAAGKRGRAARGRGRAARGRGAAARRNAT
jgi:hypothetical protein